MVQNSELWLQFRNLRYSKNYEFLSDTKVCIELLGQLKPILDRPVVEHWNTADEAHFGIAALQLSCMMVEKGLDLFAQ